MKFYKLPNFGITTNGICGNDLENKDALSIINLKEIVYVSDLLEYNLPFSGDFVGKYAFIKMSTGENIYIHPPAHVKLVKVLEKHMF